MRSSASSSTLSIQRTGTISIAFFTLSGISVRSLTFSSGIKTSLMPPRCAASSFSFSPPIGRNLAAQRDFTRHRDIRPHRNTGQHRHQRGRHRDPGRRTVFRRRAFRHVDVNIALLERIVLDAETARTRANHRTRRFDRFLHHIAQRTGTDHQHPYPASPQPRSSTDRRPLPSRPDRSPAPIWFFLGGQTEVVLAHAEEGIEIGPVDRDRAFRLLQQKHLHHLAADLRDFTLERTHPASRV